MDALLVLAKDLREACKARGWKVAAYIANMLVSEIANRLDVDPVDRGKLGDTNVKSGKIGGIGHD